MTFYVYAYLRSKDSLTAKAGTPYYIGKGTKNRAWMIHYGTKRPKDDSFIVILENNLTEVGAFALERRLIRWWGRKNTNSGILRNFTDGGEGASGAVISDSHKKILSDLKKGKPGHPRSEKTRKKCRLLEKEE